MQLHAGLKKEPQDFIVEEILGFTPEGTGQHLMLYIEKERLNTQEVVQHLSKQFGVHPKHIGYSGLKDKQAITRQYFTVDLAGKPAGDLARIKTESIHLLSSDYHLRKLKIGSHQANRFTVRLREMTGDRDKIATRLRMIEALGLPNYFGSQRFGNNNSNLDQAQALFAGKIRVSNPRKKGMLLSAVRAFLFNEVCAARVQDGTWNTMIAGDVLQIQGSGSVFEVENSADPELLQRIASLQLHPTAPLFGVKGKTSSQLAAKIEAAVWQAHPHYAQGLLDFGVKGMRRALRMKITELAWHWEADDLILSFVLGRGLFATTVVDALLSNHTLAFPEYVE